MRLDLPKIRSLFARDEKWARRGRAEVDRGAGDLLERMQNLRARCLDHSCKTGRSSSEVLPINLAIQGLLRGDFDLPATTQPIPNYDEWGVKRIGRELTGLSTGMLQDVLAYEKSHRDRVTVIRAIESMLDAEATGTRRSECLYH